MREYRLLRDFPILKTMMELDEELAQLSNLKRFNAMDEKANQTAQHA